MALGQLQNEADLQRWLQDQLDTLGLSQPDRGVLDKSVTGAKLSDGTVTDAKLATRTVRGGVTGATGAVSFGSGFSASRASAGIYTVTYTAAFSASPAVTLTCVNAAGRIGQITAQSASSFSVAVNSTGGVLSDSDFNFIAESV